MKRRVQLAPLCLGLLLSGCAGHSGGEEMANTMAPLVDQNGADPWIWQENGVTYYTKTTGNNITLWRSAGLSTVAWDESAVVYTPEEALQDLWAPELHHLDGVWYIYFAACVPGDPIHHMYVLQNSSADPFRGEWTMQAVAGMDDRFAIDGTVLTTQQGRFFIWSGWEGYENVRQDLYLAPMRSPTEVEPVKILLSQPEYNWEKVGDPLVNEGPQVLVRENTVNLLYSASGSWTDAYCLGLLTAQADSDLSDPTSWTKHDAPILESAGGVFGPGHNGFAQSPDGSTDYIIYHAARWEGAGWSRSVRMQPLTLDENGVVQTLTPETAMQPLPGGEAERVRYQRFACSGGLSETEDAAASDGTAVQGFEAPGDTLSFSLSCLEEGRYAIAVYCKTVDSRTENSGISLKITVDGHEFELPVASSAYYQPVVLTQELAQGEHTITVQSLVGVDPLAVDFVDCVFLG